MPRRYRQRERAASAEATRQRIVQAAVALYGEDGVAGASLAAVARRADVSRGTVLNHFGGAEGLLEAVLDHAIAELAIPEPSELEGIDEPTARVRAFVATMFRFYDWTRSWWELFRREMDLPQLQAREQAFWVEIGHFQDAALGPAARDRVVAAAVGGLVQPVMLSTLQASGLTFDETVQVVGDLAVSLITREARD